MRGRRDLGLERAWRRVVREYQASGLSVREFCTQVGVAESAFYFWRRELGRRSAERDSLRTVSHRQTLKQDRDRSPTPVTSRFLSVVVAAPENQEAALRSADASASMIELVHPGGIVIRVRSGCDVAALRTILQALDERLAETPRC